MALSGNQITRIGNIGPWSAYPGFTPKEESVVLEIGFGVSSIMSTIGVTVQCLMDDAGSGSTSTMETAAGISSIMSTSGKYVSSTMDSDGDGVNSILD